MNIPSPSPVLDSIAHVTTFDKLDLTLLIWIHECKAKFYSLKHWLIFRLESISTVTYLPLN